MALIINYKSENTKFCLDFAIKIYMYYNRLLFSIYKKRYSLLIYTTDQTKHNDFKKNMITFNMLVNSKSKVVNFCNVFYSFKLEYNLFLVSIIKKTAYLILTNKEKNNNF